MPQFIAADDHLKLFERASRPDACETRVLNLALYVAALEEGQPRVPLFAPTRADGSPIAARTRWLPRERVTHVVNSPLSPDMYEAAHGVEEMFVRDIRRRQAAGRISQTSA